MRAPTEPTLNGKKETRFEGREIALKNVSMIGVNDDRDSRGPGC
jgi:hypothetical protein